MTGEKLNETESVVHPYTLMIMYVITFNRTLIQVLANNDVEGVFQHCDKRGFGIPKLQ
jgi:hypothetical protein